MTHEFDGKKYEKASTHQKEWGANLIAEFSLQGTERVLDLGLRISAEPQYALEDEVKKPVLVPALESSPTQGTEGNRFDNCSVSLTSGNNSELRCGVKAIFIDIPAVVLKNPIPCGCETAKYSQ